VAPDTDPPSPESGEPPSPAPPPEPSEPSPSSPARDLAEVERGRPERAFNLGAVLGALVAVAAAVFVVQNAQSTEFDWLWLDFELPLWTALLGAMAVGVLLVMLAFVVHERRVRRISRRRDAAGRLRRALGGDVSRGGGGRGRSFLRPRTAAGPDRPAR
jgi:uncharacterized integral membrane protein